MTALRELQATETVQTVLQQLYERVVKRETLT